MRARDLREQVEVRNVNVRNVRKADPEMQMGTFPVKKR